MAEQFEEDEDETLSEMQALVEQRFDFCIHLLHFVAYPFHPLYARRRPPLPPMGGCWRWRRTTMHPACASQWRRSRRRHSQPIVQRRRRSTRPRWSRPARWRSASRRGSGSSDRQAPTASTTAFAAQSAEPAAQWSAEAEALPAARTRRATRRREPRRWEGVARAAWRGSHSLPAARACESRSRRVRQAGSISLTARGARAARRADARQAASTRAAWRGRALVYTVLIIMIRQTTRRSRRDHEPTPSEHTRIAVMAAVEPLLLGANGRASSTRGRYEYEHDKIIHFFTAAIRRPGSI